ncbi:MAG: FxsA family protein [Hyphomicrobiales bacterium]
MRFSLIPFVLLVVPLMEIAAFVVIGGQIGVWATLAMVVVTAVIGSFLLRWQGVSLLRRIQSEIAAQRLPARDLVRGAMLVIAGILLLTPGFVTDAIGFLLFVPPIQDAVWGFVKSRVTLVGSGLGSGAASGMRGGPHGGGTQYSSDAPHNRGANNPSAGQQQPGERVVDLDPDDYRDTNLDSPWSDGPDENSRK